MILLSEIANKKRRLRTNLVPSFEERFDVIVCGLGTAGSLAAMFAAENGLSVFGIESFTCPGGTHAAGGVMGTYFGNRGGRSEEMDGKVAAFAQAYTCTTGESRKLLTEEAMARAGVALCYEATPCGVWLEGKQIIGIRMLKGGRLHDYGAKIVMDCTAEALVAHLAGCETQYGRESDGQMQPYSLVTMIHNGIKYRYNNIDFGRVDQNDAKALSEAILFSRSYRIPEGQGEYKNIAQMPLLGIREGRRIVAEETVTVEDVLAERQTATPAYYAYADLDKHGWDLAFDGEKLGDWAIGANLGAYNVSIAIPHTALLPKGYDGILVPCRALGVDRDVSSCVRMNPDMKKLAEIAAEWATLAIRENRSLREVPYSFLRKRLLASGCLKSEDDRGVRIDGKRDWDGSPLTSRDVAWITCPEALETALKTEKPGEAIWSAGKMGEKAVPVLLPLLDSEDENTRKHAAFALAMLGQEAAKPILRGMVTERDAFLLTDCRKNNNLRGFMAIYWLGRLEDREIVPELIDLISKESELDKELYHKKELKTTRYLIADFEAVYFHFVSQAVMALIRIGKAHPEKRAEIAEGFRKAFSSDDYYHRMTKRPENSSEGNMVRTIRSIAFFAVDEWETP